MDNTYSSDKTIEETKPSSHLCWNKIKTLDGMFQSKSEPLIQKIVLKEALKLVLPHLIKCSQQFLEFTMPTDIVKEKTNNLSDDSSEDHKSAVTTAVSSKSKAESEGVIFYRKLGKYSLFVYNSKESNLYSKLEYLKN